MLNEVSYRSENASFNESASDPPKLPVVGEVKMFDEPGMAGCFRVQRIQEPVHLYGKTIYVIELVKLITVNQ
jgi:hypothetical protein